MVLDTLSFLVPGTEVSRTTSLMLGGRGVATFSLFQYVVFSLAVGGIISGDVGEGFPGSTILCGTSVGVSVKL